MKKRERLEIIYDILSVIRDANNSIKPTRLLHKSNLSPQMFKQYVTELLDKKMIELIEDDCKSNKKSKIYSLTRKGFEFLDEYRAVIKMIDYFGL